MLFYAIEREQDDKLFLRWIPHAQLSMGFDEFKHELEPKRFKPDAEVLDDVAQILNSMKKE